MGSPDDEPGRMQNEGPRRRVVIAKRFALGKFEVTVEQFSAFAADTGFAAGNVCHVITRFEPSTLPGASRGRHFASPALTSRLPIRSCA
jgi:formylglycine-generating enzyme required for sulfatase activity